MIISLAERLIRLVLLWWFRKLTERKVNQLKAELLLLIRKKPTNQAEAVDKHINISLLDVELVTEEWTSNGKRKKGCLVVGKQTISLNICPWRQRCLRRLISTIHVVYKIPCQTETSQELSSASLVGHRKLTHRIIKWSWFSQFDQRTKS